VPQPRVDRPSGSVAAAAPVSPHKQQTVEPLVHLIYASSAVGTPDAVALARVLGESRRNNVRVGVTGMLLYTEGTFFQVLEGPAVSVDATFATIAADARHTRAVIIIRERIARRAFGEWSMGYVTATSAELVAASAMNDFFAQATCFDRLDAGRAKKLLTAFRAGRWRARLADTPAAA
jgi:hypothetical protein